MKAALLRLIRSEFFRQFALGVCQGFRMRF